VVRRKLLAIGTSLALYRGFTNWENTALNFAGAFAVLVTFKFRRRCKFLGALMLFSPLVGLMLTLLTHDRSRFTFIAEAFGMWCFAAY
jgi:hypothetical protein